MDTPQKRINQLRLELDGAHRLIEQLYKEKREPVARGDSHELLLEMLDEAYAELRGFHEDVDYVNDSSSKYKDALDRFAQVQRDIFAFKEIQYTLEIWKAKRG